MTKAEYIGKYLDKKMKNHNLPYGFQYFNLLATMEEKAEIAYKKYKKKCKMKEGKIYISGAITGESNAFELFEEAENQLKEYYLEIVNPMKLTHNHDKRWESYMREDIKALCDCDAIYMLENWTVSKGAEIERNLAIELGIKQIYQRSE